MHSSKGRAGNHADQELVRLECAVATSPSNSCETEIHNPTLQSHNTVYHGGLTVTLSKHNFVVESGRFYFFCATVWPEIATCLLFTPCPMQSRAQIWDLHPESVRCGGCGLSTRHLASGDSSRLEFSKKYISRAHNSSKTFKIILFNLPVTFVRFLVVIGTFRNAREAISAKILKKS